MQISMIIGIHSSSFMIERCYRWIIWLQKMVPWLRTLRFIMDIWQVLGWIFRSVFSAAVISAVICIQVAGGFNIENKWLLVSTTATIRKGKVVYISIL